MKSIADTLKIAAKIAHSFRKEDHFQIALIGGYAVIAFGVGRTTADADFCIYCKTIQREDSRTFVGLLKKIAPSRFEIRLVEGSKMVDDPFKHDIIFFEDQLGEFPRIDFIIARYPWELEGIKKAKPLEDLKFPVLPKPYLIAMKLKAGGIKDYYDIVELYGLLSTRERNKTHQLAKLIRKDRVLERLIKTKSVG